MGIGLVLSWAGLTKKLYIYRTFVDNNLFSKTRSLKTISKLLGSIWRHTVR